MTTPNARRAASLAAAVLSLATLAACGSTTAPAGETGGNDGVSSSSVAMERPMAKEGEMCGGIAGIQCADGLFCQLEGAFPDASGTCENVR